MNNLVVKRVNRMMNLPIQVIQLQRIFLDEIRNEAVTFSMHGEGDGFFDGGKR